MSEPLKPCPFCLEDDFDAIGLKNHFESGHCDKYNLTPTLDKQYRYAVDPIPTTESALLDLLVRAVNTWDDPVQMRYSERMYDVIKDIRANPLVAERLAERVRALGREEER